MSNILISLDESTVSTGYAVFENNNLIDYGVFSNNSKNVLERINSIITNIEELIKKYNPNNIVAENIQITMSAPTAKALMGLQLLIELLAFKLNIPCTLYRTAHWRKVLGLSNSPKMKRAEKKKEAMQYVKDKYGIDEKIDDITDSICIGECYLKENNNA